MNQLSTPNDNTENSELKFAMPSGYGITYKDVIFFIWFGPVDMSAIDFTYNAIAHIRKNWPTFSILVIIADGSTAPTREQRAQFAAVFQQHPPPAPTPPFSISAASPQPLSKPS